jgi:hypothetical protein
MSAKKILTSSSDSPKYQPPNQWSHREEALLEPWKARKIDEINCPRDPNSESKTAIEPSEQLNQHHDWNERKLSSKQEPQIEPSHHAPSTSPASSTRSVSPTPTASQGQAQAHSLHSINGKEVGEFVANTSEDLDQYLDAKRIEHELALEEECLEFLIDIIAQEESPTLYSRCAFDEGAMRRVCLSRDAHTARVQRLRKYRSRALVRERLHPTEDKHEPGTETATARARAARSIRRAKGLRVTIDSRFIFEETDEGQHETPDSPHTHAYSLCLSLSLSLCLLH